MRAAALLVLMIVSGCCGSPAAPLAACPTNGQPTIVLAEEAL